MTFALVWVGVPLAPALLGVVTYRAFNFWLPVIPALAALPAVRRMRQDFRRGEKAFDRTAEVSETFRCGSVGGPDAPPAPPGRSRSPRSRSPRRRREAADALPARSCPTVASAGR